MEIKYYEFNEHDYYALISVKKEEGQGSMDKAFKLYVEMVAGDNVEEVMEEGTPRELTKEQALSTYLINLAKFKETESIGSLYEHFCECEDNLLLIDGCLI